MLKENNSTQQPSDNKKIQKKQKRNSSIKTPSLPMRIIVGFFAGLITLAILVLLVYPVDNMVNSWVSSGYTPTPLPPTSTSVPTRSATGTPTPTLQPTPTNTTLPTSIYQLVDTTSLDPDFPSMAVSGIVLDDDTNIQVSPDFSSILWIPSSQIASEIGRDIPEPYHATFNAGSATWYTDTVIDPGLYEIYVLDTLYSSGGKLEFTVRLGDAQIFPILGKSTIEYESSQGNPPQVLDLWRSIGMYALDSSGLLTVSTQWDQRDLLTIVAVDRILVARLPDSTQTILNQLPQGVEKYVVDESAGTFDTYQYWETRYDSLAWGDHYEVMVNPPIETGITWSLPYNVPAGKYEIRVWVPRIEGTVEVKYSLYAIGNLIMNDAGEENKKITQGDLEPEQWLSIGTWTIPDAYGENVQITLNMTISGSAVGEVAADAVTFIRTP